MENLDRKPEEWAAVKGYGGNYAVSNIGRVMRVSGGRGATAGRIISQYIDGYGYPRVNLWAGGVAAKPRVHSLVSRSFIGDRPDDLVVNHINAIKTDNRVENLEYITHSENVAHAHRMGLIDFELRRGTKVGRLKAREIRERYGAGGVLQKDLAAEFGVSCPTISQIVSGGRWRDKA